MGSGAMEIRDLVALSLIISREQRLELARDNLPSDLEWGITSLLLLLLLLLLLRQLSPTINSSCLNSYHAAHENSLQTFPPCSVAKFVTNIVDLHPFNPMRVLQCRDGAKKCHFYC